MAYLSKTPDFLNEISRISPALTEYLESLVSFTCYKYSEHLILTICLIFIEIISIFSE